MRKLNTWISSILVLSLVLLTLQVGLSAYATETADTSSSIGGEIVLSAAEYDDYLESLAADDLEQIDTKAAAAAALQNAPTPRIATKISIPGTFSMYQQSTDYYCVPACVKSIVQYINGSSDSQSTIASALGTTSSSGTDPTTIAPYLNEQQSSCYYVYVQSPSQTTMCNALYYTINTEQVPASMGISGTTTSNWYYATSGHSLVVNAIYSDKSKIQFADPLGATQAGWPVYYEKSASVASSVCTRVVY
ncbi:hypothetical protein FACS1894219_09930 [Clostridia bacterium]|nr:hypothetical protein FACS1894219_09930 [Clostridia bacterium]